MVTIRSATPQDAAAILALAAQLDAETAFMLLEPGERTTTPDVLAARLQARCDAPNSGWWLALDGDRLVGYLSAEGGRYRRNAHSASLVVGIRQAYSGQGIGTRLFATLLDWARGTGIIHRLELTVMTHNAAAVALYRKMGFAIEGTRQHALRIDGMWVDEYHMARLLD